MNRERAMTTTFNAAATKTVGVNATNFEFTFTRLERIAFGPGKITTLRAELERMGGAPALVGADALVAFGGGSPIDACKVAAASLLNRRDMTLVAGEIDFDGASRAGGA